MLFDVNMLSFSVLSHSCVVCEFVIFLLLGVIFCRVSHHRNFWWEDAFSCPPPRGKGVSHSTTILYPTTGHTGKRLNENLQAVLYYTEIQFVMNNLFQHKQLYYCICVGTMLYFQWALVYE